MNRACSSYMFTCRTLSWNEQRMMMHMLNSSGTQEGMTFFFFFYFLRCFIFQWLLSFHSCWQIEGVAAAPGGTCVKRKSSTDGCRGGTFASICPFFKSIHPCFFSLLTDGRRFHFITCMLVAQLHVCWWDGRGESDAIVSLAPQGRFLIILRDEA